MNIDILYRYANKVSCKIRIELLLSIYMTRQYAPSPKAVFSYGDKMKTGTAKVGSITQNIERKRARFQEKYSKGGITRAAVNENVCEDSHTEHV